MCRHWKKSGLLYIYNELAPAERNKYENHIRQCGYCSKMIETCRGVLGVTGKTLGDEPMDNAFKERLLSASSHLLRDVTRDMPQHRFIWKLKYSWAGTFAFAVMLFLLFLARMSDIKKKDIRGTLDAFVTSRNLETLISTIDREILAVASNNEPVNGTESFSYKIEEVENQIYYLNKEVEKLL